MAGSLWEETNIMVYVSLNGPFYLSVEQVSVSLTVYKLAYIL